MAVTDHVLEGFAPPQEAASWGFAGLLAMVLQRVQGLFLSAEEREIRQLLLDACERFGSPLINTDEVESLDDLDDRIDAVLYSDAFHATNARLNEIVLIDPRWLRRFAAAAALAPVGFEASFVARGLPAVKAVGDGDRLERAVVAAVRRFFATAEHGTVVAAAEDVASRGPLGYLTDPTVPPEVAKGLLGFQRATVCLLALGAAMARSGPLAAWLAQGLADRRTDGLRAYLRVLASNPVFGVPLEDVSATDRFDWHAVHARRREGQRRLDLLLSGDVLPLDPGLE